MSRTSPLDPRRAWRPVCSGLPNSVHDAHFGLFRRNRHVFRPPRTIPWGREMDGGSGGWPPPLLRGSPGAHVRQTAEYISFAGDSDRPDMNYFLITPTLICASLPECGCAPAGIADQLNNDSRVYYKAGVQLGHMFTKKFGLWSNPRFSGRVPPRRLQPQVQFCLEPLNELPSWVR